MNIPKHDLDVIFLARNRLNHGGGYVGNGIYRLWYRKGVKEMQSHLRLVGAITSLLLLERKGKYREKTETQTYIKMPKTELVTG